MIPINPSALSFGTCFESVLVTVSFMPVVKSSVVTFQPICPSSWACARNHALDCLQRPAPACHGNLDAVIQCALACYSGAATAAGLSELTISADPGKRPSFGRRDLREVGQADPREIEPPPTGAPTTARSARMFPGRRTDIHRAARGRTAAADPETDRRDRCQQGRPRASRSTPPRE